MNMHALKQLEAEISPRLPAQTEWLLEHISQNRFLPQPPADSIFVGDGDYRAIGSEFLRHFVTLGGLRRSHRVLDVGSGIGRMAVPLTQFLHPERGSYEGFDPVLEGVMWCTTTITPAYPRFRFQRLDVAHALYNPGGVVPGAELQMPFPDGAFDFSLMVSVATHLPADELETYIREISRVLAPSGRLFLTAFVLDETAIKAEKRDTRLGFKRSGNGPCWFANQDAPLAAVGFDDGFIDHLLRSAGFDIALKSLGHWRGVEADHYQDVFVAMKRGGKA
ncbi:methyltransferase [Azorhizobium oxalatiphilum]|uniref:Methyltransferase n=1 Tax=Azorhizobium oxalatiphilum TaxID=980631 RepID=A0A917C1Q6_9HYPH|nr:class I SAM-dependent methyltransferase [Azorhizobium oxalatiphilum]GGF66434.1 methyltransferase [Azorhizobium oxalatiphilum]